MKHTSFIKGVVFPKNPKTTGGPHDGHIMSEVLPDEGHILIYNKAMYTFCARAIEANIKTSEVAWDNEDG